MSNSIRTEGSKTYIKEEAERTNRSKPIPSRMVSAVSPLLQPFICKKIAVFPSPAPLLSDLRGQCSADLTRLGGRCSVQTDISVIDLFGCKRSRLFLLNGGSTPLSFF